MSEFGTHMAIMREIFHQGVLAKCTINTSRVGELKFRPTVISVCPSLNVLTEETAINSGVFNHATYRVSESIY